jgi:hypothetical protein
MLLLPMLARARRKTPDAIRSARYRARRHNGHAIFRLELDRDALIMALLVSGRLTEAQALDHARVERELAGVLAEWAARWRE